MNVTINQIRQEMTTLVQAHEMVNSFFWGDFHRAYNEKDQFYPLVCSYLSDGSMNTNLTQMQLVVIVCDKTFKGFENLNDTESDTVTVARHLFNVIKQSPRWNALLRVNSATLSKFIENTRDEVAGVILTMNVDVKQSRSLCDLPLDNYHFDGTFVGNKCEPVLIVNSNQTFTFSADSGTIVELPDTPVLVTDQDGNPLGGENVPSVTGGSVEVTIAPCEDANYIVEYANGTPIDSGTIPSGGSETIVVPNCEDATYNLDNTEGSTLFLGSIPSGDNETIIAPDGTANVKNTAGTTVATGLVPSGGSANITAPDGTLQINGEQVATVASGGMVNVAVENESGAPIGTFDDDTGVWVVPDCPDGTVTVNRDGVFFADVPVSSGGTETVNVPSFANKLPTKSGQTLSYATGDDGDDQRARETSFFHLTNNNPFGNNRRFTGTTGGYHLNSDNTFRDKDGNVTTKALAFPNDIMIDWAYFNGDNLSGEVMMWYLEDTGNLPVENREWLNMISNITALSVGGYTGWKMPNITEYSVILFKNDIDNLFLNYEPFAANGSRIYWSNETVNLDVSRSYRLQTGATAYIANQVKTNQAAATRLMAVRYGNYTTTGGNVLIS
jgi:hypothetical protein